MEHAPHWLCLPPQRPLTGSVSLLSTSYIALLGQHWCGQSHCLLCVATDVQLEAAWLHRH